MSDLNNKIIPVRAWQLTGLLSALERLKSDSVDTSLAKGVNTGLSAALDMFDVYLGPQIAEAKTPSNIEILTNH